MTSASASNSALKSAPSSPHPHRVALDKDIGVFAAHPGLGQGQQHALRMHEATEFIHILHHVVGVDDKFGNDAGEPGQRKIQGDGRIRANHPLDRGMADVALMPKRHVFQRRRDGGADEARQPGQVLGQHRVALVRHGRGALLAFREKLLCLKDFGALHMADFRGDVFDRGLAMTPSVAKNIAWRSRGMTWVEIGSGVSPSFSQT